MQIKELIQLIDNRELAEAKPKVKPDGKGGFVDANTGNSVQAGDNTIPFPNQQGQGTAPSAPTTQQSPTGDATLDQPLPAKAPKDPNAPGLGAKAARFAGQMAKGIGAVAGGAVGMGRAMKKGYQAGVSAVGGPGAASAPSAPAAGGQQAGSTNVDRELDDLRQMINRIDAKLVKSGIKQ